jgi:hypothetical protein
MALAFEDVRNFSRAEKVWKGRVKPNATYFRNRGLSVKGVRLALAFEGIKA